MSRQRARAVVAATGRLVRHEAEQLTVRLMMALRAQGKALRAIAKTTKHRGFKISYEGLKGVLGAQRHCRVTAYPPQPGSVVGGPRP
jgi:hypothetical protein